MTTNFKGEVWKEVKFDFEYTNEYRLEVSNLGQIRSFNKVSKGNLLNGSMVNGYPIIRLKFFKPRDPKTQGSIAFYQQQILEKSKLIKELKTRTDASAEMEMLNEELHDLKKKLAKQFKIDTKERTIHFQSLIHKLVAENFCVKPSQEHSVISHLDYNKLNNKSNNLKWMTPKENSDHQQKSPFVIEGKKERDYTKNSKVSKLTVTKVMLLKKLLNQGKPLRTLVKQFKVTDTQILRIKRGENWKDIPAAGD